MIYKAKCVFNARKLDRKKPPPNSMVFGAVSSARIPYTYTAVPFTSAPQLDVYDDEVYVPGNDNLIKTLVDKMASNGDVSGRCISYHRYDTYLKKIQVDAKIINLYGSFINKVQPRILPAKVLGL